MGAVTVSTAGEMINVTYANPLPDWRANPLMLPSAGKVAYGWIPTTGTPDQLEAQWGAKTNIIRVYDNGKAAGSAHTLAPVTSVCQSWLTAGVVPVLNLNLSQQIAGAGFNFADMLGNGTNMSFWAWIANGYYDTDGTSPTGKPYYGLGSWGNAIKSLSKGACPTNRIMLTFCAEMENMAEGGGDGKGTASGTSAEYASMMRHAVTYFRTHGATNILYGLDGASAVSRWGETMTDSGSSGFYPGHAYCDWVGWDPYNSAGVRDGTWRQFSNIMNKFGQLDWWNRNFSVGGAASGAGKVYKPIMICEFGTVDAFTSASGVFSDAGAWFDDMIIYLGSNADKFRWVNYYNNSVNTVLNDGSYRKAGSTGRGTNSLWATAPNP